MLISKEAKRVRSGDIIKGFKNDLDKLKDVT